MPDGKVKIIPFTGTVEGELFQGVIMPGAADVQVTNPAGVRHMCAQYMLEGKDYTGAACHIFVENHGYFEREHRKRLIFRYDRKNPRLLFSSRSTLTVHI